MLVLTAGAACLPSPAAAGTPVTWAAPVEDGLYEMRPGWVEARPEDGVEPSEPAPATDLAAQAGYRILVSDGETGELYLRTPDAGALHLQAEGSDSLPPVSVDSGTFELEVSPRAQQRAPAARRRAPVPALQNPASPRKEPPPRHPPRVQLTGVHVAAADSILQDRKGLTFSFIGIDSAARSLRFQYRLTGLEPGWIATSRGSVRYADLQPGPYRFEVQAVNDAGLWSEPASLPFRILPLPWWQRHPSLLAGIAAATFALLASLFATVRTRRLLQIERLRASIAADLHDQVGAGLTDIAILSAVATRKAGDLPELQRIAATARELVDGMGDLVWLINPRWDALDELFLRLKDSYAELFAHRGAQLEVVEDLSALSGIRLSMPWRQNLHLLFKEALRNALRHSGCQRAELSVTLRGRRLEVLLRDDGRGFDPERLRGQGEGLDSMQRRARNLGGCLTIESSPEGTTVCFAGTAP